MDSPILDETARIQGLALKHPEVLADAVERMDRNAPSILYHKLQVEGSSYSRWTAYGNRAVDYVREACHQFRDAGLLPDIGARVASIGCGDGLELEELERQGYIADGIDLDPEKVRVAQYCGLQAKVGDMHVIPLTDGLYDGVFCSHTLEHARDVPLACQGLRALLKPGGLLFCVVPLEPGFPRDNPSHTAVFRQIEPFLLHFIGWEVREPRHLNNPEPQVLVLMRKPQVEP